MSWDRPIVLAVVAATLSGAGFVVSQLVAADRSALALRITPPRQGVPIVGQGPTYDGQPVFCEVVKFDVTASHNQKGKQPIQLQRLAFEAEPIAVSPKLSCKVDDLHTMPKGIVPVREYEFVLRGPATQARLIDKDKPGGAIAVDQGNIFASRDKAETVTLTAEGSDAHFQIAAVVEAGQPGLYRVRFTAFAVVADKDLESKSTPWTFVYLQ